MRRVFKGTLSLHTKAKGAKVTATGTGHRILAIFCAAIFLSNCRPAPSSKGALTVVTSVSPITSLVESVAGNRGEIVGLIPEGVDSHTFEPSPSDVRALAQADLVIVNGLHLETRILELAKKNLNGETKIVTLGEEALEPHEWIFDRSFPKERNDPNPHLWTNPLYALRFVESITEALAAADPDGEATFRKNSADLLRAIGDMDAAIRAATQTVQPSERKLLTYHDSFPYFAREYGWQVIGAIQPADFKEPSAREVTQLIEQVRSEGVRAIFGSEVYPSTVLRAISEETGARYVDELRDDDLPGETGDPDHTYIGLMRYNMITIIEALGGDASAIRAVEYELGR